MENIDIRLSNGSLVFTSINGSIRTSIGKTSGKWYWEVKLNGSDAAVYVGVANSNFPVGSTSPASNANWRWAYNGTKYPSYDPYGAKWNVNEVIGVALDSDNGTLEFYKNGVSIGISHTDLKTLGEVFPVIGTGGGSFSRTATINFGYTPFSYAIPRGYSSYASVYSHKFLLSSKDKYYGFTLGSYNNSLPIMTSNTTPSGTASASNEANSTYLAYKAFDKSTTTRWIASSLNTGWIAYSFPIVKIIKRYALLPRADSLGNTPKSWNFEGSNDGVNWVVLDTQSDIIDWVVGNKKKFDVWNQTGYLKYRLNILATVSSGVQPSIDEFELFEKTDNELVISNEMNEDYSANYGSSGELSKFNSAIQEIKSIESNSSTYDSGKTFEHTIDMSKRRVDKITLG